MLAACLMHLQKYSDIPFELEYISMDPGYAQKNRSLIESNAKALGIPVKFFETNIFSVAYNAEKNPCYLCAKMRRGHLYDNAKSLGCNKIALGHHFDDVIETILMSMIYGAEIKTMMPKLHSTNFEGMELIRPLYLVKERDIISWKNYNSLEFLQCACKFTSDVASEYKDSKRLEMKNLVSELRKVNSQTDINIFRSVENVNLGQVIATKKGGVKHSFLEDY